MSAVIIGLKDSENQITTLIQDNPTVLFNTPTQPTFIGIQNVDEDRNKYYLTLYANDYKINFLLTNRNTSRTIKEPQSNKCSHHKFNTCFHCLVSWSSFKRLLTTSNVTQNNCH